MRERLKIPVEEYTSPNPIGVQPQDTLGKVIEVMADCSCRHVPVVNGQVPLGIISDRDIYQACWAPDKQDAALESICAKDIMTEELFRVNKADMIDEVVLSMSDKKIGSAIVEDDDGLLYGIFTSTDALNALIEVIRDPSSTC